MEVKYTLTREHARQAAGAHTGKLVTLFVCVALALLAAVWAGAFLWEATDSPLVVGVSAGLVAFFALATLAVLQGARANCVNFCAYLDRYTDPHVTARFTDDGITFRDEFTTSRLPWSFVSEVRRCPSVWLLVRLKLNFHT